jgi:hypothetical protein
VRHSLRLRRLPATRSTIDETSSEGSST